MLDYAKYNAVPLPPMPTRRAIADALKLLTGDMTEADRASLGTTCEKHWGMKQWREAVSTAVKLQDAGMTFDRYCPRRAKLRPDFVYLRMLDTGEELAVLKSSLREGEPPWFLGIAHVLSEDKLTGDQLAAMERDCCEMEIERCGL